MDELLAQANAADSRQRIDAIEQTHALLSALNPDLLEQESIAILLDIFIKWTKAANVKVLLRSSHHENGHGVFACMWCRLLSLGSTACFF
jgi:hypothetical protein